MRTRTGRGGMIEGARKRDRREGPGGDRKEGPERGREGAGIEEGAGRRGRGDRSAAHIVLQWISSQITLF